MMTYVKLSKSLTMLTLFGGVRQERGEVEGGKGLLDKHLPNVSFTICKI